MSAAMSTNFPPNKLVAELGAAHESLDAWRALTESWAADDADWPALAQPHADRWANEKDSRSECVMLVGYLGGTISTGTGQRAVPWRLLYDDASCWSWVLMRETDISLRQEIESDFTYDVLWLPADAAVAVGRGGLEAADIDALSRRGAFVRARDVRGSTSGMPASMTELLFPGPPGGGRKPRDKKP